MNIDYLIILALGIFCGLIFPRRRWSRGERLGRSIDALPKFKKRKGGRN